MDKLVSDWLERLDLGVYSPAFAENDVDMRALPHLTEADLRELGVSLGHRRVLLAAIGEIDARPTASFEEFAQAASQQEASPPARDVAEHRLLSVLFADIVGSTELSQRLEAEQMRDTLRGFQDAVAGVVSRYGGYVAKYLGDGALAYFGWPTAYEDHAERSVHAGLEIITALGAVQVDGARSLGGRVGIATGRVVVGDLASAGGIETGAIAGETPNLAARLQTAAAPGEVVIGPATRRLVGDAFLLEPLGQARFKGFEQSVEAHRVVGKNSLDSRFAALRTSAVAKLVGRTHEKGILQDRWRLALGGAGQTVLISGDAGVGKSRLVEALATGIDATDHELVRLQCSPYHATSAFHPIGERVVRTAGILSDDPTGTRLSKIEAMLRSASQEVPDALEIYAEMLSIPLPEDRRLAAMAPQDLKERTIQTIVERTAAMAAARPVLMVVEDSHWIDPSTQEALERVAAAIVGLPVLMIVTQRPDGASEWTSAHDNATLLSLGLLDRDQTAELVASIIGADPKSELVSDIEARAGGVPLFVEELARAVAERGSDLAGQSIPDTLQGSLMARLDGLTPGARNAAMVASAIGREFDVQLLGRLLAGDAGELNDHLRELADARIIVSTGTSTGLRMFRHALIQDTAYQSMLSSNRRAQHLAIARQLERGADEVAEREPELVARHFTEAGEPGAAIAYWSKAADRALARSANFEAVSHAEAAVALIDGLPDDAEREKARVETTMLLGHALESAGNLLEACKTLRRAADLARSAGDYAMFAEATVRFSTALFLSSNPVDSSLPLLKEALELTPPGDEPVRCKLLSTYARGCILAGDAREAAKSTREALKLVRRLDDKDSLFSLLISDFLTPVGIREAVELGSWRAKLDEMLAVAEDIDDSARGRGRAVEVFISAEMGDRDSMDAALERLVSLGAERQHMHLQVVATQGLAMKAILNGEFAKAETLSSDADQLGQRTHGQGMDGVYGMQMFTIRREQGRLAEVAPVIRRMLDENPKETAWKPGFAVVASDLGHLDAAGRMLREMAETDFAFALDAKYSTTLAYLAETCAAVKDAELAERLYDLLHPYEDMAVTAGVTTVCLGAAARHLGLLCTTMGEWDRAERHFEEALALNGRMRTPPWIAWTGHDLASMLTLRGRPADDTRARNLVSEAMDAASELGMVKLRDSCTAQLS